MVEELIKLTSDREYEVDFHVDETGEYRLLFKASAPTNWSEDGNESVMVRIFVDHEYNQDIICFYGSQPFTYERLLGQLSKGVHTLRCEIVPLTKTQEVTIEEIHVQPVELTEEEQLVYRYSPLLYGRSVYGPYDQLHTDTPLLLIYSIEETENGKIIEYHVVFSHEDEGTPAPFLMAKWGRLLDIELALRVYVKKDDGVEKMEFQGDEHIIMPYQMGSEASSLPILQTATCNGNFTDKITSSYRARFVPKKWERESEPREFVMEAYPFVNRVMIWEAERQLEIIQHQDAHLVPLVHPCHYAYIQASFIDRESGTPPVEFLVKFRNDETWYSSSFQWFSVGEFEAVYTGEFMHFATTLKCPPEKSVQDIEEITWSAKDGTKVKIGNIRVYELGRDGSFTKCKEIAGDALVDERK